MGNFSSTSSSDHEYSKVELYHWSSEEFQEEYELKCTSRDDETPSMRTCSLRLSANRDKVFVTLVDRFSRSAEQVRVAVEVKGERDNRGNYKLGVPKVNCEGQVLQVLETVGGLSMDYPQTNPKKGFIYMVRSCTKSNYSSSSTEYLAVSHTHCFGNLAAQLRINVMVVIECDKAHGLSARIEGPFKSSKGISAGGLCIDREEKGMPPNPIINCVFKSTRDGNNNGVQASSYEIIGAVNNVGAQALGQFNQSSFHGCQITLPTTNK